MATADVHEEQLRDLLYRYWVKAGLALKYFKEGIEGFIDDCIKDQQRDILDEIRRQIGHPDASCDQCDVQEIRPHHKSSSCRFGKKCYCRDSRRIPCPNDVCGRIFDKIVEQHRYGSPSFRNTDATKWCSDHWEIAKCFLDKSGYAGKMSASDTDCKGLLNIITNNMFVHSRLDTPIDKDKPDVFSKTKSARNEILHQAILQVTEEQLTAYIDTMIEALEDKKLKDDARSKTAIQKLKQLKDRALSVSTSDAFEVRSEALKAIDEKRQEVLEIIEEKKQDAIDVIEEKKEVDRLTTQYNQMKESLDNFMSSTSSNIQNLISRQDDLERQLADLESLEKMRELKALVLEKRADLKTDLVAFYRHNHSTLPLAPLVDENDAPIRDFYVKPSFKLLEVMAEENMEKSEKSPDCFHSYREIFFDGRRRCRNIYITSQAGMGKTSFVKHLVMTWCHAHQPEKEDEKHFEDYRDDVELMKSFEFIFIIALRDAPEEDCDVDTMIQNQIMEDLANRHCYDEENFLKEILAKETCLIILDGLDEWSHPVTKPVTCRYHKNKSIPSLKVRENCTLLTTTRPWKFTKANISEASIDKRVEIKELSDSSFDMLIDDALSYMNARNQRMKQPEDFKAEIEEKDLDNLERIPLILMQLLCLWFDDMPIGSSRCAIFSNMLELLFQRAEMKHVGILEKDHLGGAASCLLPSSFIGNSCCSKNILMLRALGAMSFDAIFSEKENHNLTFDSDFLSNYLSPDELQFCLKVGILTQSRSRAKILARESKTWFIHKTYQEFLAALHLSLSATAAERLTEHVFSMCCSVNDILDMSLFFKFVYGLCPDDICVGISNRTESIVEQAQCFQVYRTRLIDSSDKKSSLVIAFVFFMYECASERKSNNHSNIEVIPLKDFIVLDNVRIMTTVYELLKSKQYCMKSILCSAQTFPDSVEVSKIHSVQGLRVQFSVDEDSVRTIISNSLDTIFAIHITSPCLGVVLYTLNNVKHLQALCLCKTKLTCDALSQLYSRISQSTTLKEIVLDDLNCGDEKRCHCNLSLDLSAHEHLQKVIFRDIVVDEVGIFPMSLTHCRLLGYRHDTASALFGRLKTASKLEKLDIYRASCSDVDCILQLTSSHRHLKFIVLSQCNINDKDFCFSIDNENISRIFIFSSSITNRALCGLADSILRLKQQVTVSLHDCISEDGKNRFDKFLKYYHGIGIVEQTENKIFIHN